MQEDFRSSHKSHLLVLIMSRNFNTREMKVAFFDVDEDARNITHLEEGTMKKLLQAIDYSIERGKNRNTDVRMFVVLDLEVAPGPVQGDALMAGLKEKNVRVLVTGVDLIVGQTEEGHIITIKFAGAAGFVKHQDLNQSGDSSGSGFGYVEEGLTQECNLNA